MHAVWHQEMNDILDGLDKLSDGWDGLEAKAPNFATIAKAAQVINFLSSSVADLPTEQQTSLKPIIQTTLNGNIRIKIPFGTIQSDGTLSRGIEVETDREGIINLEFSSNRGVHMKEFHNMKLNEILLHLADM